MNQLAAAIALLIALESGGDPMAVGDDGAAVGCLQIHEIVVQDVNRILGEARYAVVDRYDPDKSVEMAQIYLSHYCSEERLSRPAQVEDYVRCWNGGPDYRKAQGSKLVHLDWVWSKASRYLKAWAYSSVRHNNRDG